MKVKALQSGLLLSALTIFIVSCLPLSDTTIDNEMPTASPFPSVTALAIEVVNTSVPEPDTPTPTPQADSDVMTATPRPPTPWPETGLPVLGSLEAPPADSCVVYQNGRVRDEDLPLVRSGPGEQFGLMGQMGRNRWANGLQRQDSWYEIIVGPGVTGWVHEGGIGTNNQCGSATGQEIPTIMNRGAPSKYRCVAMQSGVSQEAPPVYLSADPQSTLIARLGNWADVHEISADWYNISLPEIGSGWIEAGKVELNMGCGTSGPIRIEFPTGATGTTIEGKLPAQTQVEYLFWAAEGQWLDISITSPENSILFHVSGVSGGQVIKHLLDGESSWQGTLPLSQDYLLTLDNAGNVATYTILLSVEDAAGS